MVEIALTESAVMEAWKPQKAAPLYRKSIVLEVIGKSSCSSFGVKVELFFFNDQDVVPTLLHALFQFVCISDSKITVLLKKPMVEYPEANIFPPFWKLIKQLALNDSEIDQRRTLHEEVLQEQQQHKANIYSHCLCCRGPSLCRPLLGGD
uniref:Uncharacterized protein n=1 Tax=Ditylenchus dipsaci TaxID=166011 RepID=A0A915ESU2_9BILA